MTTLVIRQLRTEDAERVADLQLAPGKAGPDA